MRLYMSRKSRMTRSKGRGVELKTDCEAAVVGLGLIGAAAVKYLAGQGCRVIGIGSPEPRSVPAHREVFSSHYDDGRIVRILDFDRTWAELAQKSLARFRDIEQRSRVRFHYPQRCLHLGDAKSIEEQRHVGELLRADFRAISGLTLRDEFPSVHADGLEGLLEAGDAGFLSPRSLIRAQLALAARDGAVLMDEVVTHIDTTSGRCLLRCASGKTVSAARVLVTAGSFVNFHELLPRKLPITVAAETVVRVQVPRASFDDLPGSFICLKPFAATIPYLYGTVHRELEPSTILVKIGTQNDGHFLSTLSDAIDYFQSGGNAVRSREIFEAAVELFPGLSGMPMDIKPCVLSYTPTGYPIIDHLIPDKLFVVAGCCGAAAKSSDEIGRIAAALTLGQEFHDSFRCPRT